MGMLERLADGSEEIMILEGTANELVIQGLLFNLRDIGGYLEDVRANNEVVSIEQLLDRLKRNHMYLLSLFDKDTVMEMLDIVEDDTAKRVKN